MPLVDHPGQRPVPLLHSTYWHARPYGRWAKIVAAVFIAGTFLATMGLGEHFFVDLVVRTGEQVRQRLEWNDFFLREIIERGKVLHAAADRDRLGA